MPDLIVDQDEYGRFRWKLVGGNHHVLAVSPQSYADDRSARRSFSKLLRAVKPMVAALEVS